MQNVYWFLQNEVSLCYDTLNIFKMNERKTSKEQLTGFEPVSFPP